VSGVGCRWLGAYHKAGVAQIDENGGSNGDARKPAQRKVVNSYEDLLVWQLGMDLAVACYRLSRLLPKEEMFGLSSQLKRAASSVPANIAEGYGRGHRGEYIHFLHIAQGSLKVAQGSLKETETHIHICVRVGLLRDDQTTSAFSLTDRLGRALHNHVKSLQQSQQ
jgi:four helix bundle protein